MKRNQNLSTTSHRAHILDWVDTEQQSGHGAIGDGLVVGVQWSPTRHVDSPDSGYGNSPVDPALLPAGYSVPIPAFGFGRDSSLAAFVYNKDIQTYNHPSSPGTFDFQDSEKTMCRTPNTPKVESTPTRSLPLKKRPIMQDQWAMVIPKPFQSGKKPRAARKLNFDHDTKSPVTGTFVQEESISNNNKHVIEGEASAPCDGAKTKGLFVCKLCQEDYHNPLSLAQHKCSRIVHVEYRCSECDKVFNCHANLASHRRWHKPRPSSDCLPLPSSRSILPAKNSLPTISTPAVTREEEGSDSNRSTPSPVPITHSNNSFHKCEHCKKKFRRPINLRKHLLHRHGETGVVPCRHCGQIFGSMKSQTSHTCRTLKGDVL